MGDILFYIAAFAFVIALIVLGAWLWRSMLDRGVALPGNTLFRGAREKRIGAIESASIDARRKLVLIRRDGVEHLIMTGGPVDIVIETGIEHAHGNRTSPVDPRDEPPTFTSPSLEKRLYGKAMSSEASSSLLSSDD